jgi:HEAT repeat protein
MYWVANLSDTDPDGGVRAECIATLSLLHHHGMGDLSLTVYEKHLADPDTEVRKSISRNLSWMPAAAIQRVWAIVQRLASDQEEEVRRALAFEFTNMEKLPQLLPIAQHMAQQDPSPDVRREALGSMAALMPANQAATFYAGLLAQSPGEQDLWAVLNGLRHHREDREAKRLLSQLGQCPYENVANAARDALS